MKSTFILRPKIERPIGAIALLLVVITPFILAKNPLVETPTYMISELTSGGQVPCQLNNLGDFVGRGSDSGVDKIRAVAWTGKLKAKHWGILPGGEYSSAFAINDDREVAGSSNTGSSIVPFIWKVGGNLQRIPLLSGNICGQAFGINKHGHVVGYSSGPSGTRAFLWTAKAGVRNLGPLPGGSSSIARAVNDLDEVAGTSTSPAGNRAVLWTNAGNAWDLGMLPGDVSSEAMAINSAGDVVGYSKGPGGLRAFLWTKISGMEELSGNSSEAFAINDAGVVVGTFGTSSGDHAFVWKKQTGIIDLNDAGSADALGVVLVEAHAINKKGEILAMGTMTHETMPSHDQVCAPAPPLNFLLQPK